MDEPQTQDLSPEAGTQGGDRVPSTEEARQSDNRAHEGGDPTMDGDAQYGASPLRSARYDENHEATADIADGKTRSGHHGAQARYPATQDPVKGPTGHDEQQQSRDLAKNGR